MRVVVYTALFGDIDHLWSVLPVATGDCRHVCFTDRPRRQVGLWRGKEVVRGTGNKTAPPIWETRIVETDWNPRRSARHYKALPHRYLSDADVWIWVDANVRLVIRPQDAVKKWLRGNLATFRHPDRVCLYDEAEFCRRKGKAPNKAVNRQIKAYQNAGMPRRWGLPETRCVIRRNTERVHKLNDMWWEHMEQFSARDQISLPFACWKLGLKWDVIPGRVWVRKTNNDFWFIKHKGQR